MELLDRAVQHLLQGRVVGNNTEETRLLNSHQEHSPYGRERNITSESMNNQSSNPIISDWGGAIENPVVQGVAIPPDIYIAKLPEEPPTITQIIPSFSQQEGRWGAQSCAPRQEDMLEEPFNSQRRVIEIYPERLTHKVRTYEMKGKSTQTKEQWMPSEKGKSTQASANWNTTGAPEDRVPPVQSEEYRTEGLDGMGDEAPRTIGDLGPGPHKEDSRRLAQQQQISKRRRMDNV